MNQHDQHVQLQIVTLQDDDRYEFLGEGTIRSDRLGSEYFTFQIEGGNDMTVGVSQDKATVTITKFGDGGYTILAEPNTAHPIKTDAGQFLNVFTHKIRYKKTAERIDLMVQYSFLFSSQAVKNKLILKCFLS